jgi:acetyl-CoA carboxylase/biotin carboxylase 1
MNFAPHRLIFWGLRNFEKSQHAVAKIRTGQVVYSLLDASINASVMEMYAASGTARGGVLEANGAASVKYRTVDLRATMHRLDDEYKLKNADGNSDLQKEILSLITSRENA